MRQPLTLAGQLVDELRDHARAASPREACGLLGGDPATGVARRFHPVPNAAASAYLYRMDPADVVRAVDAMTEAGDALLAIVHSHPASAAVPSPTDLREAAWPGVLHVIVSLDQRLSDDERVRAWWIEAGRADEGALRIR